jgi:acyl transferase domain-containing protein
MEPMLEEFTQRIRQVKLAPPNIPFISNVTGAWIRDDEATDPGYWARHVRQTVRFAEGVEELLKEPNRTLLEVGPGQTLCLLANMHPAKSTHHVALASLRPSGKTSSDEQESLLDTLGQLWLTGVEINWHAYYAGELRHRIPLPTYPFQRESYWIETPQGSAQNAAGASRPLPRSDHMSVTSEPSEPSSENRKPPRDTSRQAIEQSVAAIWEQVLGVVEVSLQDDFFELGGTSILIMQVIAQVNEMFKVDLSAINLLESPTVAGLADCVETVIRIEQGLTASAQR